MNHYYDENPKQKIKVKLFDQQFKVKYEFLIFSVKFWLKFNNNFRKTFY